MTDTIDTLRTTITKLEKKIATYGRLVDADTDHINMLVTALRSIRDEPPTSPRHAQIIAMQALSPITTKQREVADRLVEDIKHMTEADYAEMRENLREENEYMAEKEKAQKPTREQMQREFNI